MADIEGVESAEESDSVIGTEIGGYTIEAPLGEGGMGRVYKARARGGDAVAVKLIREDLASDMIFRKRFAREARVAKEISSRHLVPVLSTGEHEGIPYLAQRFIGGGTLQSKLDRDGPLSVEGTLRLCAEVADGLDALFASGFVHRDVKPANVLLEDETALLSDFGLTKDNNATELTRAGQTVGSIQYMAPEQIRAEAVDAATDIYGLGCVVVHCLTGAPPFGMYSGMRVVWAQLQAQPADPAAGLPDVPARFGHAVLRALAKDRSERPQRAGEYASLLYQAAGLPPHTAGNA